MTAEWPPSAYAWKHKRTSVHPFSTITDRMLCFRESRALSQEAMGTMLVYHRAHTETHSHALCPI